MTSSSLSAEPRSSLLQKLDAYHPTSSCSGSAETESDSQLVLRRIEECGRYSTDEEVARAVQEYVAGKPLAYITGTHTFGPLSLIVRPPVYIPRVETEQWVLQLGERIHDTITRSSSSTYSEIYPFRILDICSGSGCIPLLLAYLGQGKIHTVGLEVDDRALAVARENAKRNKVDHVARFEKFDLFDDSEEAKDDLTRRIGQEGREGFGFDMVVSNPPYVSSQDMRKVESTWHEGKFALQGKLKSRGRNGSSSANANTNTNTNANVNVKDDCDGTEKAQEDAVGDEEVTDGDDGYSFYRRIKEVYSDFLDEASGANAELPKLVLEVGSTQSQPVQEMYASEGRLEVHKETARRKEIGAPKLEEGDMVGTERSIWVYRL